jgi:hypothetical protein
VATSQSLLQLTKGQINYYLEKAECGYSTKLTAANKEPNKMATLRSPNVATPQSLLQLTKNQIYGYLE